MVTTGLVAKHTTMFTNGLSRGFHLSCGALAVILIVAGKAEPVF